MNLKLEIRKKLTLICSLSECLIFGGPTFGWASLVYILRDRGYFSDLCSNETAVLNDNVTFYASNEYPTCAKQDAYLQLVFIIGAFGVNSTSLFFGPIYDKFGTMIIRIMSSVFIMLACLMFAFSTRTTAYLLFPALHLLASGGILILISIFQVGNLFGSYRSTVVTLHSGAFGSSAVVMLFVKIAYSSGVSMTVCFLFLAGISLLFNINTFILLPKYKIPWPLPDNWGAVRHYKIEDLQEMEPMQLNGAMASNVVDNNTISWIDVEFHSLSACYKSPMFFLFLTWFSVIQLTHFFYIGTFNPRFQILTNDDQDLISIYTTSFTAIQSAGVFFAPLCGLVVDRNKRKTKKDAKKLRTSLDDLQDCILAVALSNIITAAYNITMMIPVLQLQFATFFLQVIARAFLYGTLATFISTAFPGRYFGSIYGVISIISACVALLQFPLLKLVQNAFDNNSLYVDLFLLVLNMCTLSHPLYVYYFVAKKRHISMKTEDQAS